MFVFYMQSRLQGKYVGFDLKRDTLQSFAKLAGDSMLKAYKLIFKSADINLQLSALDVLKTKSNFI